MKKKIVGIIFVCTLLTTTVVPAIQSLDGFDLYDKSYYGIEGYEEMVFSIDRALDDGYITAGKNKSYATGHREFQVFKTKEGGGIEWQYKWPSAFRATGTCVKTTSDNSYIAGGYYHNYITATNKIIIQKLKSNGDEYGYPWPIKLGYEGTQNYLWGIEETSTGDYIAATQKGDYNAYYDTHIALIWIRQDGVERHWKTINYEDGELWGKDRAIAVKQTSDGGYIVTGVCTNLYIDPYKEILFPRCFIAKLNPDENSGFDDEPVWMQIYGDETEMTGTTGSAARGYDIQETEDGGYIISGMYWDNYWDNNHFSHKAWLLKTDEFGNPEWGDHGFTYGGGSEISSLEEVSLHGDKYYVSAGWTGVPNPNNPWDIYVIRVDLNGNLVAEGFLGASSEKVFSLKHISGRNFVIAGYRTEGEEDDAGDTDSLIAHVKHTGNIVPDAPIISGEIRGIVRQEYDYTFCSTDDDVDIISHYIVDWGDLSGEETIEGPFESGEAAMASHKWLLQGDYMIKAKAVDSYGGESEWGYLPVKMPIKIDQGCPQGTQITMAHGTPITTKSIENLLPGDHISSYNPTTQEVTIAEVVKVYAFPGIIPENRLIFNGNLAVTTEHNIFINEMEWKEANDAILHDVMLENIPGTALINPIPITMIDQSIGAPVTVYDLVIQPIIGEAEGYWANGILVGGYD